jgi:fusicocca-2,10(14)-diene synthase
MSYFNQLILSRFWFGLVTFAMGLKIPEEEIEMSKTFMRSAWIVLSLTNDLYSWPKEYEAAVQKGQSHVVNAIWVLMHENSLNANEAKTLCCKMIKEYVSEYIQMVKELRINESLSLDLRKYLDAMQ